MDMKTFFDKARAKPFGGVLSQSAVDGVEALIAAFAQYGDGDERKLAYILGTAYHESDRFQTMEEYASGSAYEGRADLGNTEPGDGKRFKGRGLVQVTGRRNYADWSRRLGVDLLADPEIAEKRPIAARICVQGMMLGTFTGKKLGDYISERSADYVNARRVVNGTDKASVIAGYAREFEAALKAARFGENVSAPVPVIAAVEPAQTLPTPILATIPASQPDPIAAISKAVGAAKGGALGAIVSTGGMTSVGSLLSAASWLPTLSTTQLLVIFGGLTTLVAILLCAGFAFWRAYKAPPNAA